MSRSPFFFVEKPDSHTNKYELQHPVIWNWNHTKQKFADLYPYNGDHDLFSIVEEKGSLPSMVGIHRGLPADTCEHIKEEFKKSSYEWTEGKIIEPEVRWFTYADMLIYCLQHPEVKDYDAMDEQYYYAEEGAEIKDIMKPTPLNNLKYRVDAFLEVMNEWNWRDEQSQIRIVYWIN